MIKLSKINNEKVKPLKIPKVDENKVKGSNLFPNIYSNIFCLAKKMSGKSTTIYKILKECVNKNTKVFIFCSTVYKDSTYGEILKLLDKKGVAHVEFTSIMDNGINNVEQIIDTLKVDDSQQGNGKEKKEKPKIKYIKVEDSDSEDDYVYKPKKIAPEIFFIFDDLSTELKMPCIASLMKKNRHFKSKVILSSQYLHDLRPESIQQLDYMLMFQNIPEEKLKLAYSNLDLSINYPLFSELYHNATHEKYNFFYIDIRREIFRKNFNLQYSIDN